MKTCQVALSGGEWEKGRKMSETRERGQVSDNDPPHGRTFVLEVKHEGGRDHDEGGGHQGCHQQLVKLELDHVLQSKKRFKVALCAWTERVHPQIDTRDGLIAMTLLDKKRVTSHGHNGKKERTDSKQGKHPHESEHNRSVEPGTAVAKPHVVLNKRRERGKDRGGLQVSLPSRMA